MLPILCQVEELRGKNSVLESKAVQLKDALGKVRRECVDQKDTVIMLKESEKRLHETVESKLEVSSGISNCWFGVTS